MSKIRTISSEVDLKKSSNRTFKYNLSFEQNAFYFGDGAKKFYSLNNLDSSIDNDIYTEETFNLLKKVIKKNEKISLISLGCGKADQEKKILKKAQKNKYDVEFYGIDSSMSMIELAQENMKDIKFPLQFIYADFSNESFKESFDTVVKQNRKRIFAFYGATLGNVPQNYMANTLRNMLKRGDILLLDVRAQKDFSDINANKYFKQYLQHIKESKHIQFLQHPLKELNIPLKSGKLTLEMTKETPMNSLLFKFGFLVNKKIEFELNNEKMVLLNGDSIDLINLRVYDFKHLKDFFEKRNFKMKEHFFFENRILQIAFEKQ